MANGKPGDQPLTDILTGSRVHAPAVEIRAAALDDGPAIAALMADLDYPTTAEVLQPRLARLIESGSDEVLVAVCAGRLAAVSVLHLAPLLHVPGPIARLTALVVSAAERGRGVGSALVLAMEERARALGCPRLEVTSAERRHEAHEFYLARGYDYQGRRFVKSL